MLLHIASNILLKANSTLLDSIKRLKFHIHTSAFGNHGRNEQLLGVIMSESISNIFADILLAFYLLVNVTPSRT
jgi:hypothetical protein